MSNFLYVIIVILLIAAVLASCLLVDLLYELVRYIRRLNEKNDTNKLNHNKTQSEIEAQTKRISTSKESDTE